MCNHYRSDPTWREKMGEFSDLKIPIFDRAAPTPNFQSLDIWPGYMGEIARIDDDGMMRPAAAYWRMIPWWFKGSMKGWARTNGGCNNAKGETAETNGVFKQAAKSGRCIIPAEAFFEYAADRVDGKKPEFRFKPTAGGTLWLAALCGWAEPEEGRILTYTMVTKPAGPDVSAIGHPRQPVNLEPAQFGAWLDGSTPMTEFLEPSPALTFMAELAPPRTIKAVTVDAKDLF